MKRHIVNGFQCWWFYFPQGWRWSCKNWVRVEICCHGLTFTYILVSCSNQIYKIHAFLSLAGLTLPDIPIFIFWSHFYGNHESKFWSLQVLDRLCLLAFTSFTVILSAAALIAAPHVIVEWRVGRPKHYLPRTSATAFIATAPLVEWRPVQESVHKDNLREYGGFQTKFDLVCSSCHCGSKLPIASLHFHMNSITHAIVE